MRYLFVLLVCILTISSTFAADITIRDKSITVDDIDTCKPIVLAYRNLLDEPAAGAIVVALEEAGPKTYIRFSKSVYDDACTDQPTCNARTTQTCTLLGGVLSEKGARVSIGETKQSCAAQCVVNNDLTFRIKFVCEP